MKHTRPTPRTRSNESGLTLLELMLAVAVVGMVATIAYGMLSQVIDGVEVAREKAGEMRVREFLSRNLRRNLNGVYLQPWLSAQGPVYFFEGVDGEAGDGAGDSITFFTTTSVLGATAMPGDIKQVTIEVVGEDSEQAEYDMANEVSELSDSAFVEPTRVLQVVETPVTGADVSDGESDFGGSAISDAESSLVESPSWTVPIESFNAQYYFADGSQGEWVDEWHSDDYQRLPWAIRISINFPRTEEEREYERSEGIDADDDPDFILTIPLMTSGMGIVSVPTDVQEYHPEILAQNTQSQRGGGGNDQIVNDSDATATDNDSDTTSTTESNDTEPEEE